MKALATALSVATALAFAAPASAVFLKVEHVNLDECDDLIVPVDVDELGLIGVFPTDEQIEAGASFTDEIACPGSYLPNGIPNTLVTIVNLTPTYFDNLWYVADPETRFTNVDGLVNGEEAFKIDTVGLNRPLVSESLTPNGIFEPGETWQFIVDNYSNINGLPASALLSPGAVGVTSGGDTISSASIIATRVPEPTACLLVLTGLAVWGRRRR